jgi:hypothetical protein
LDRASGIFAICFQRIVDNTHRGLQVDHHQHGGLHPERADESIERWYRRYFVWRPVGGTANPASHAGAGT